VKVLFLALSSFGISLAGCGSTCFSFASNQGIGNVNINAGDLKPTCTLTTVKGAVRILAHTVSGCSSCSGPNQVRHILVSLRGIAAHPGAVADSASPDWQELMPHLSSQPLQIDLMNGAASPPTPQLLGESVTVPAGAYSLLRIRFEPNQPASDRMPPEKNACGRAGFNCIVLDSGQIQPLPLNGAAELFLGPDRIAASTLLIPPDSDSDLIIDFGVSWALSSSDGQGLRLLPALTARAALDRRPVGHLEGQ
jgi:hypothetical protein